ncbi:methyltransferase domain-containing protein [Rhodopirellula sp. JC740]|uniref:Methyltransferase domain-containing protein n=1 Tax=Rhodopirellula halodulae TaxID=2894198 RepID=A0ABS8NH53_9BACT|nr:methyltransferase domain-containing protein [Rhodopirellula sp. JC740]MCC9642729.1 methyltransferase domain-containing protein [Rhodopirellula sp. JC740]
MFELRCTVRNCGGVLSEVERGLKCEQGHHFDRAREGYYSLSQPQDRKSKIPGDADAAVEARHRWLQRGHGSGLIEALKPWVAQTTGRSTDRTVDLGCGEGSFGPALFANIPQSYCGIDLSKKAIKLASRGWKEATWVWANADRALPIADASVLRVVSLFGRRPTTEMARILTRDGVAIVAVPGEEDLIELREHVQQSGQRRSRWQKVVDEMAEAGLRLREHRLWKNQVELDGDAIADAMAMTYRGVRFSQNARVQTATAMRVTLAADLMLFEKAAM